MSKEKLGLEAAFPTETALIKEHVVQDTIPFKGMSKRFYAACAAMQGIMGNSSTIPITQQHFINIVEDAYMAADELLKQENE